MNGIGLLNVTDLIIPSPATLNNSDITEEHNQRTGWFTHEPGTLVTPSNISSILDSMYD